MKYLIRNLALFSLLLCSRIALPQQITVEGKVDLDSGWARTAYFSSILDFNKMYLASEDILIGEANLDSVGHFRFSHQATDSEGLYRIHFIKKNTPKLSIIIGGADENHGFFLAGTRSGVMIKNGTTGQRFEASDPENARLNYMFRTINSKDLDNKEKNVRLIQLADSSQEAVLALLSIYETFNLTGEQLEKAKNITIRFNGHSQYAQKLMIKDIFSWQAILTLLVALIILSIFIVRGIKFRRKFRSRKLRETLSQREWEIVNLMLENKTNKEMAEMLNIEVSTVKTHVNNIFSKVGVKSRGELQKKRNFIRSQ
jgi:DNA-binding CsgD family transcriptional regulator